MNAPDRAAPTINLPATMQTAKLLAEIAQRSTRLGVQQVRQRAKTGFSKPTDDLGLLPAYRELARTLLTHPLQLVQLQMKLADDFQALRRHAFARMLGLGAPPVATPRKGDNRFKDPAWDNHLVFDVLKQGYLIAARHIHELVTGMNGMDEISRKKVSFFTRQLLDAMSPANFALTNPEVMRETVLTGGTNILKGLNNLLKDIEDGGGTLRVKMTDPTAFEPGRNVAVTPGKVVYQNDLIQLLQFSPTTPTQLKRPLLIIPPWINKYYILDLRQSNSFIKYATDQGHTVFCISWVNPDGRLAKKGFEDYLEEGALAAIDAVCKQTGEQELNVIGYCLGGTLLGSAMGYMAAKKDKRVASSTFFVSLLDFSVPGELGVFIDEAQVANLEKKMERRGYLEGSEMGTTFNMLRSSDLIWSFMINNYLMGKDPVPFDLLYWNSDSTRMPYKMHSFYLRNMYLQNKLRLPGGITLLDTPIDLSKSKIPAYFISTVEDHIAPWKGTYLGSNALGGPVRFVLGGSGHIAGIVNPPSANKYGFWTNDEATGNKRPESPDEWFAGAKQHEGSWWTDWQKWITGLDGDKGSARVPARDPAKGPLKVLDDAPGSFVKFRLDQQKLPS